MHKKWHSQKDLDIIIIHSFACNRTTFSSQKCKRQNQMQTWHCSSHREYKCSYRLKVITCSKFDIKHKIRVIHHWHDYCTIKPTNKKCLTCDGHISIHGAKLLKSVNCQLSAMEFWSHHSQAQHFERDALFQKEDNRLHKLACDKFLIHLSNLSLVELVHFSLLQLFILYWLSIENTTLQITRAKNSMLLLLLTCVLLW